ncbi:AraC family transcriptional regulator [Saccharibacillus sp. O23]|uniref:helix-turn-helix transcriptional regulator n=1 Tax=Saccharibacillus sp. O23 TaxID=2009338 RepID=UPI000B4E71CE|nr:helix-turn-helix domain-containing protein [Saccharibacillus sp. O23]OWR28336.1 AraC family transcriptional regulator [Saccharibacillus sp. O23]
MDRDLEIFSDFSERLKYNVPDLPICAYKDAPRTRDARAFAYHWHADLEFMLMLDGAMTYYVNGQAVPVTGGMGIFVNSKRLHRGIAGAVDSYSYILATVHPSLLGETSPAAKAYSDRKFGLEAEDYLLLSPDVSWQREILDEIVALHEQMERDPDNPLHLLTRASSLCALAAERLEESPADSGSSDQMAIIHEMTGYIHQRYESKLTVDEIAAAGSVCRSRCCQLFKQHLHLTPNNYLIQYRIQKSCEMLKETNRPVSEIALACGFQSASYFAHVFHKHLGETPQDFRRKSAA